MPALEHQPLLLLPESRSQYKRVAPPSVTLPRESILSHHVAPTKWRVKSGIHDERCNVHVPRVRELDDRERVWMRRAYEAIQSASSYCNVVCYRVMST